MLKLSQSFLNYEFQGLTTQDFDLVGLRLGPDTDFCRIFSDLF